LIILSDVYDDGWHAYVDGKRQPVYVTDHLFRGVAVPAGNHTIEYRYEPLSLHVGLAVTGIASLAILACLVVLAWKSWTRRHVRVTTAALNTPGMRRLSQERYQPAIEQIRR
jgi:uncharacterized membrane protein YfhO